MAGNISRGFKDNLMLVPSVIAYGSVLGLLAAQKGLDWVGVLAMSIIVFAGSAQFVMVEMWQTSLPYLEMTIAVAIINLRYMLIGATLHSLFVGKSIRHKLGFMHFVADENWAITIAAHRKGQADTYHLLGGGLCMIFFWSVGTVVGNIFGSIVIDPELWGLDFAFTAVFTGLAVSLLRGRGDALPWIAAIICAIATERFLPGKWYILVGGIAGSISAMLRPQDEGDDE